MPPLINHFVIVGVESTGKSSCAEFLSNSLPAKLIPEYAREYLELHSNTYTLEDFLIIAAGQKKVEDDALKNFRHREIIIFDTDFIVIYIWSKIVYGKVDEWIIERIKNYSDRIYFLMSPDVEWVNDGMREYPDIEVRRDIHLRYIEVLELFGCSYYLIEGNDHTVRQNEVLSIIKELYLK